MAHSADIVLAADGIAKSFPGVRALDGVQEEVVFPLPKGLSKAAA